MIGAFALAAIPAQGQPRPGNFAVTANRILVNAVVMDRQERLITGLDAKDFQLTVDKSPARIDSFWREDGPVSTVIVLDASGSMAPALKRGREALDAFLQQAYPGDEYALVLCREKPILDVPFTGDAAAISSSANLEAAKGKTPLYDALGLAMDTLKQARNSRRLIFVLSDGLDNASRYSQKEVERRLAESDAFLYAVEFWTPALADDVPPPRSRLEDLAEITGGVFFGDVTSKQFVSLLSRLDIHQRYLLTFAPRVSAGDGKYHKVGLELTGELRRHKLQLYWRHGYFDQDPATIQ